MDPLSTTAGIIAVLQLTTTVVKYLNNVKNASKDQKRFAIEASNLLALLTKLKCCLEESAPTDPLHAGVRQHATKNGILDQYKAALETLVAKVIPEGGAGKVSAALLWPFKQKEIEEILRIIERLKSLILFDFEISHLKLSQAIKEETESISSAVRHSQDDELSKVIANWLSPIDFSARQTDLASQQQEGTGMWFLESQEFSNWIKGVNATLFCPGIPGAGKTMISSLVINHLRRTSDRHGSGVVFLYCNYKEDKERKVVNLLSALLKQLVQELPHTPAVVQTLHKTHEKEKTRPSLSDISTTIRRVFEDYTIVYIVVDALDECPDEYRDALLSELKNLQAPRVRLMVTSRPAGTISEKFKDAVKLPIKAHGEDVKSLVQGQIPRLARCVSDNQELKQRVISAIHDAVVADGIFLLAQLLLDSLVDKITPKTIRLALKSLPTGSEALSQTYGDAVERIKSQAPERRDLAKTALSWIIYAKRPLSVKELQHALATEIGERQLDEDNITHISDIVSACAGLVTIDGQSDVVRLIHYTAQEYFDKTWSSIFPAAQRYIVMACISYLSFDAFDTGFCLDETKFDTQLESHALYNYAAGNWGHHAHTASMEEDELILNFLKIDTKVSASCKAILLSLQPYEYNIWNVPKHITGMHLAAYFGLKDTITALLKIGHDPHYRDTHGRTPLFYAAMNRQNGVFRQLLAMNGVYPECKDRLGRTLLSSMAKDGHEMAVKHLLARDDIDPDSRDNSRRTPLSHAAEHGHEAVVRLLLANNNVDPDSTSETGETPLSYAAKYGYTGVVKLLLENKGVKPNIKNRNGRTPLSLAVQGLNGATVVELLLSTKSVDPDSQDEKGRTPLSYAATTGSCEIVKLLLAKPGVDPDSEDREGRTPLSWAVVPNRLWGAGQHRSITQMFLADTRINPDYKDAHGRTPLSYAAVTVTYNKEVLGLLLADNRIDPDSKDADGRTPLSYAATWIYNEEVLKILLADNRIDPDSKDADGRTPLSYAATGIYNEEVLKILLADNRIDPDSKDDYGRTPLSYAATGIYNEEVLKILLADKRINPNSKDSDGRTPLSHAAEKNRVEMVMKLLLAVDSIDPDTKDVNGRTPLSYAVENPNGNTVVGLLLAQSRVDPNSKDASGRTPLSHAAEKWCLEGVKLLLATGRVDPRSTTIGNHNLLSWVAENWYNEIVKVPTQGYGIFLDLEDYYWISPHIYEEDRYTELAEVLFMKNSIYLCSDHQHNRLPLSSTVGNWHEVVIMLLLANKRSGESSDVEMWCKGMVKLLLANDGRNLNFRDASGRTLLWLIASSGHEAAARLLLETEGVEPESTDKNGRTPLFGAVINGHDMAVRLLLARDDVNPDCRDEFGLTPLSLAAWQGCEAVVKLLLADSRVDPNSRGNFDETPLLLAAVRGHTAAVELLLTENSVDPNSRDLHCGNTPLLSAAKGGHEPVVKLLLAKKGISLAVKNNHNQTSLWLAACYGYEGVAKLLLARNGDDLNTQDNEYGITPLLIAACNGHSAVVELLLGQTGIDIDPKGARDGRTPLSFAAENGRIAVMKLLLEKGGVDLDSQDATGSTPLSWAMRNRHWEAVNLLNSYSIKRSKGGVV